MLLYTSAYETLFKFGRKTIAGVHGVI